jgi:S1-C subfamily serine protease
VCLGTLIRVSRRHDQGQLDPWQDDPWHQDPWHWDPHDPKDWHWDPRNPKDPRNPNDPKNPWDPQDPLPLRAPEPPRGWRGDGGWRGTGRRARAAAFVVPLALVVAAGGGAAITIALHRTTSPQSTINAQTVYNQVEPSIVDVSSSLPYAAETAEGTGFVIDAAHGLVLTNNHVVDGSTEVTATLVTSGRSYHAKVLGDNALDDVALLRLDGASGLVTAPLASGSPSTSAATLGAPVLGIGNSGGQGGAPTIVPGYISSLSRTVNAVDQASGITETLRDMLQVSAPIQPGDSGGPLADAAGQVIGMDTAATQASPSTAAEGFAIPIGTALADARQLMSGQAGPGVTFGTPAFLGVVVADRSAADPSDRALDNHSLQTGALPSPDDPGCLVITQEASVPARVATARYGALVEGAFCGSAAAAAGLRPGDVITAVGGTTVSSARSLNEILTGLRPGQNVTVQWVPVGGAGSGGGERSATVRLGEGPAR